jgi:poly(3-hydroxybutyrate) depolymerase
MNRMSYQLYEMSHLALAPSRAISDVARMIFKNPMNPLAHTTFGRNIAASAELYERMTRRYGKPVFGFDTVEVAGERVEVIERVVWERPFCRLVHFERQTVRLHHPQPRLLIVAPMSGHYATLLRGTVETFLPTHEVYITDWSDARMVPLVAGRWSSARASMSAAAAIAGTAGWQTAMIWAPAPRRCSMEMR